jgi:AcrR family transcriptional regulator
MDAVVRAAPLSPDARRASIIAATLPLLRMYGREVTTSQIALAAGVAEGTLFRAFSDKEALITATVASVFDPTPGEVEVARIDPELPLRDKLITAIEMLQRRVHEIWQLFSMLGLPAAPEARRPPPAQMDDSRLRAALAKLFESHRDEIRYAPEEAARFLRAIAFAGTHPRLTDKPMTPHEVVTLLLDGIQVRHEET